MTRARAIRQTAARLAEVARSLRDQGGDSKIATHRDLLAQTVTYALLLRRWNPSVNVEPLLAGFTDAETLSRIDNALDQADLDAALAEYASQGKDPAIYFYEDFLRACDPDSARGRGVHYSPPEVVSCIVTGIDSILRESFHTSVDNALIVDPCCGVGTFLRHIERHTAHHPRMIGIEMMPVPHAIASCLLEEAELVHADWLSTTEIDANGRVLVILGNPPYSGHSSNPGKLASLMADYRAGLKERNPKWLQDDYVKFIRMAQHQVERAGRGIVAFITNHSYLTNPTFRGMRESLARTFDQILVLDLHGNVKRLDDADANIFPIQMGVAISFFIKTSASLQCDVRYCSIGGSREQKLQALRQVELSNVPWSQANPAPPFYLFTPHDASLSAEYHSFPSLFDIFGESTIGFITSRDAFAVGFTRDKVLRQIAVLRDGAVHDAELRDRYGIGDLDIEHARRELRCDPDWQDKVIEVLYRPFDRRWAYYSRAIMERPRLPFMENLMRDNIALAVGRAGHATGSVEWDVVFCTDRPADLNLFRRGGAKLFPRYVYRGEERLSNIRTDTAQADALFAYIYALLHSRAYRSRYSQFLQMDYPRIPIPEDSSILHALAQLGSDLLDVHLMRSQPDLPDSAARLIIGGYDIPAKCFKDRAGTNDPDYVKLVHSAVAKTLSLQKRIDEVIAQAPPWRKKAAVHRCFEI